MTLDEQSAHELRSSCMSTVKCVWVQLLVSACTVQRRLPLNPAWQCCGGKPNKASKPEAKAAEIV